MNRPTALVALALALALRGAAAGAGPAPPPAPAAFRLAYRAAEASRIRVKELRESSIESADGHREEHGARLAREFEASVEARHGELVATVVPGRERLVVDGELVAPGATVAGAQDAESGEGCFTAAGAPCEGVPGAVPALRLPAFPVAVGETWSQTLSAGPDRPLELVVTHRLVAVGACPTGRCARIESAGQAEREGPDGAVELHLSATTLFALEPGLVLKSRSEARVKAVQVDPTGRLPAMRIDRSTRRVLVRDLARAGAAD